MLNLNVNSATKKMALIAHRMMLRSRSRPKFSSTQQQLARNKVGVLLVPSLADYYNDVNSTNLYHTQKLQSTQSQMELSLNVGRMNLYSKKGNFILIFINP